MMVKERQLEQRSDMLKIKQEIKSIKSKYVDHIECTDENVLEL